MCFWGVTAESSLNVESAWSGPEVIIGRSAFLETERNWRASVAMWQDLELRTHGTWRGHARHDDVLGLCKALRATISSCFMVGVSESLRGIIVQSLPFVPWCPGFVAKLTLLFMFMSLSCRL